MVKKPTWGVIADDHQEQYKNSKPEAGSYSSTLE
jgi:hypothetical protein